MMQITTEFEDNCEVWIYTIGQLVCKVYLN